jgi:hypothetical protein
MAESTTMAPPVAAARPAWSLDRRLVGPLLLAWAGTLAAADLFQRGLRPPTLVMVLESLAYLVLYAGLLSFAPVRRWLGAIPSPHRAVVAGFVACATWGQLVVDSRATFPFVAWTMYARPEVRHLVEYYRYRGIDARGREVWVDPAQELTFVNSAEIASRVKYIGRSATSPEDTPQRDEARERVRDLLGTLAAAYDRSHTDAPLRSLDFVHYAWDYGHQPLSEVVPSTVLSLELPRESAR